MSTANMSDKKNAIIQKLQKMAGQYSVYTLFDDWVTLFALSLIQQISYTEEREQRYLQVAQKYDRQQLQEFCKLNALYVEATDEEMNDILGYVYMHLELGSSRTGQFFTPYHTCQLLAEAALKGEGEQDAYECNEPSCGGGGNIIAFAEALKKRNINYQQKMKATCQDLDIKAVYMCYIQCTFYGIPAIIFQSDTLTDPEGKKSSTGKLLTYGYVLAFWNDFYKYTSSTQRREGI